MPYATEKTAINDPFLDRRGKLIPCQKERIVQMHNEGRSISHLSRIFGVSRQTIQYIVFPDRYTKNKKLKKKKSSHHSGNVMAHKKYKETLKPFLIHEQENTPRHGKD